MEAGIPTWANAVMAIGGLSSLVGGLALMWKNHRDANRADKKDDRDADRDSVDIVNSWREQAKASAEDAAQARKDARATRERLEAEMRSMRSDIAALLDRVEHLERVEGDLTRLAGFIVVVKAGVEQGVIPPWPSEPPHVAALMSQIKREDQP